MPEGIVDKIRKLLRLARDEGATEAEAANALAMAQRLMLAHNIEHVDDKDPSTSRTVMGEWMNVDRDNKWEYIVASAVAHLYTCRSARQSGVGAHQFIGKPENIAACEYTFIWVCEQVEALYKNGLKAYKMDKGGLSKRMRGEFRRSFKEGCAMRIYHRCMEIVAKARNEIPQHMALVVVDNTLKEADELMTGYKTTATRAPRFSTGTLAGRAAGDQVKLQGDLSPGLKKLR